MPVQAGCWRLVVSRAAVLRSIDCVWHTRRGDLPSTVGAAPVLKVSNCESVQAPTLTTIYVTGWRLMVLQSCARRARCAGCV